MKALLRAIPYGVGVLCILLGFILLHIHRQDINGSRFLEEAESVWTTCQTELAPVTELDSSSSVPLTSSRPIKPPLWQSGFYLILLVGITVFISWNWSASAILLTGCAGFVSLFGLDLFITRKLNVDIPCTIPLGCCMLACVICVFLRWNHDQTLQHKTQIEHDNLGRIFEKMLSPEVAHEVLKRAHRGELETEGIRSEVSILFADIRGFTELANDTHDQAEKHVRENHLTGATAEKYRDQQGAELLRTVNIYLAIISDVIMKHGGTLDKYIGDCVMAFWGEPTPNPRHAQNCVQAAVAIQKAIFALNRERQQTNLLLAEQNATAISKGEPQQDLLPLLPVGIGINTGETVVGFMGSKRAISYTILGSPVNLASRLERLSGMGKILIGEITYQHLLRDDPELAAQCVPIEPCKIKGFQELVQPREVNWKTREMAIEEWAWYW